MHRKPPTIQDVARFARVSTATVSRTLSEPERVSEATRERVLAAVRDTGYTPNLSARSLRQQKAKSILAAVPGIGNPFYSTIIESVIQHATERGYGVMVASRVPDDRASWLKEYFDSHRVDGMLLFDGGLDTKQLHSIAAPGEDLPLVVSYDELADPHLNSVITDNRQAAMRAVEHLASLGHRAIGHISSPSRNEAPSERTIGFRTALQRLGLEVREDWIFRGDYTTRSGQAAGERFVKLNQRPSAIFAGNDEMAMAFIAAIREHGLSCPADVSVIGFDDISLSQSYAPRLTTMRQPREAIGRRATKLLIDIVERARDDHLPAHVLLRSELVVRESTAPFRLANPQLAADRAMQS